MRVNRQHFGNFVCLGTDADPFATTKRLLDKGIITIPRGEEIDVPQELVDQWFKIWQEQYLKADNKFRFENPSYYESLSDEARHNAVVNVYILSTPSSDEFMYVGDWSFVLGRRISAYRLDQSSKFTDAALMQTDSLMAAAKREVIALNRVKLDEILTSKGHLLSQEEKKKLEKFFLYIFDTPPTDQETIEVQAILDRIYKEDAMDKTVSIQPWDESMTKAQPWNSTTGKPTDPNVFIQTDWETEQAMVKRDIAIKDAQYISPLETAFLKAGDSIKQDIQKISTTTSTDPKSNTLLYLALGIVAIKLLRR